MKRLLLFLALLPLAACGPEEYQWNQRMTLVVETPDGIVTGSSVVEVNATYCPDGCGLAGDIIGSFNYRGEAVAVEVLPGQWLFALIGEPGELIYHARPDFFGDIRRSDRGQWARLIPNETEPVALTDTLRPRLVTFGDIGDPVTVAAVDPDNLSVTFGEGVRLVDVTLEVANEPRTTGIVEPLLQWLPNHYSRRLDGARYGHICAENRLANGLSAGAFTTEVVPSENPPPPIAFTLDCLDRREHDPRPNHPGPPDAPKRRNLRRHAPHHRPAQCPQPR